MSLRHLDIPTPDGSADAVLAGEGPSVLFLMDAIGLRPVIDEWVERIAVKGYRVLAPNLFYREGRAPVVELPDFSDDAAREAYWDRLMPVMRSLTPDLMVRDAAAYLDALDGPVGVVGYCMGGRMAFLAAEAQPERVAAVATFHAGNLATEAPDSPHLGVDKLRAEVYVGHADEDGGATPEQQARLEEALTDAGVPHVTEQYDGAHHGWTMRDLPVYDHDAAERHFERLIDLFERTLKA